ncbi:MAG: M15 family metallopeptidase [Clostridia bacterium]|nr:M15 family metallopeptidase [Clostridia bacterium]MBQ4349792.1 M15 family metallopeptidase [Clostridia bacterium]
MKAFNRGDVTTDPSGFVLLSDVIPHIVQEIRYFSTYNFIGDRIDGYEEPCALLTKEAARALKAVSNEMIVQGYRLKIFDAYRPACAVKHFVLWGLEDQDVRMKPYFYPDLEKQALFKEGYIAARSGHSRGSTVDLTLLDMRTGREVDMGSPFDLFSEVSHPDYRGITDEQYANRMMLQHVMVRCGFRPLDCEWWHFTLENEPYPDTYFEFPVSAEYLRK